MPQNATELWNNYAPGFGFDRTTAPGINQDTNFRQAYRGTRFAFDFNRILVAIDRDLRPNAAAPPGYTGDDLLIGSLVDYPDDPQYPPPSP